MPVSLAKARAAKPYARKAFNAIGEVVGVGLIRIERDYAIKVNLKTKPRSGVTVPRKVRGVPVRVEVVGRIYPR